MAQRLGSDTTRRTTMSFHPETSTLANREPSQGGQRGSLSVTDCSTVRPRALDLFCCAGGAGMGLHRAGFDVHGVDIAPQPNYPFGFTQGDALAQDLSGYDLVWASPPCQAHTPLKHRTGKEYECFIERTRAKLKAWGGPYIIENVMGAPLINPVMLCGAMFPGLRVYRHRIFESNIALTVPPHPKHVVPCAPQRQRKAAFAAGKFVTVTGDIGRLRWRGDGHRLGNRQRNEPSDTAGLFRISWASDNPDAHARSVERER